MNKPDRSKLLAVLIGVILMVLAFASLFSILFTRQPSCGYVADIYQDGELLTSISLTEVTESYTFTVTGTSGGQNEIEVRPSSIGILSANCPDKLCVHQGFISDSKLPITCLPNRLVIQLHPLEQTEPNSVTVDIITY